MPPSLTVVLPTITGREEWLEKARASYARTCDHLELIVVRDVAPLGAAWQQGGDLATGDYVSFGADDVEMIDGWWQAAAAVCDRGFLPAPVVLNTDGTIQSCGGSWERMEPDGNVTEFTRSPFIRREWWGWFTPMLNATYFTDNWFTYRAGARGVPTVVSHGFRFTHHMVAVGRDEGRMGADANVFNTTIAGEAS